MKNKIKKMIKIIWGTTENLKLKINISLFFTSIVLSALALLYDPSSTACEYLMYAATFFMVTWVISTNNEASAAKLCEEFFRLIVFLIVLLFSLQLSLSLSYYGNSGIFIGILFTCLGIFYCIFYIVSKLSDILSLIHELFKKIKMHLFNSTQSATNKFTALIENITAFLVTVGALTIAIKTIVETTFQIAEYLK